MYQPIQFTFVDAREFDGDPYEVAGQSIAMLHGVLQIADKAAEVADLMARNAYMERNMATGEAPAGDEWPQDAQGRQWAALREHLVELQRKARILRVAAEYDPKHPPKVT